MDKSTSNRRGSAKLTSSIVEDLRVINEKLTVLYEHNAQKIGPLWADSVALALFRARKQVESAIEQLEPLGSRAVHPTPEWYMMTNMDKLIVVPAYGRDYTSVAGVFDAFNADEDFRIIGGGPYVSKSDLTDTEPGFTIEVRFSGHTKVMLICRQPDGSWKRP